jgi:hypothetical protein
VEKLPPLRCMRQAATTASRNCRQATGGGDDGSDDGGDDDNDDGGGSGGKSDGDGDRCHLRTPW